MKPGRTRMLRMLAAMLLVVLVNSPALAVERGPVAGATAGGMIIDLIVLRPLGLAATVIGGAVYIVSLPFSLAGGNAGQAGRKLVGEPAQFTFVRPLGDFRFADSVYQ